MNPRSLLRIAWKNLWSHRLRTILTIGGVSLGIGAIVFLVSLGYGLERLVTSQVADFAAFTTIDVPSANLKTGKINADAIAHIRQVAHVTSVDEVVDVAGRVHLAEKEATTETVIVGSDTDYFKLSEMVTTVGHLPTTAQEAVINQGLASLMGFDQPTKALGQHILVDVIIPQDLRAADGVDGSLVKTDLSFTIAGVIKDTGNPVAYVSLSSLANQGVINRTSLKLKVDKKESVDTVRKAIENLGFSTEYVGDTVAEISQFFSLFRIILAGLGLIALIIAGVGMFNTLTISLMERIREIGLLKTLGIQRRDIFKLLMVESLTLSVIGGFIGIALSSGLGWIINLGLSYLATRAGSDAVTVYWAPAGFMVTVAALSLLMGFVTGFYPTYRAIKTDALDVLRYE